MSKAVKKMIVEEYRRRLGELSEAMLIDIRGIDANTNNAMRVDLARKGVRITVLKNSLARQAFSETGLAPLNDLIEGPTAIVYGQEVSVVNIARELLDWAKQVKELDFKGAVLEGTVFGPDQIKQLSQYPTREEAQAQVVQLILSPASRLSGQAMAPGARIAGILKELADRLEKGQAIEKVA